MSITIAIPSKGRMKDDTLPAFAKAGLEVLPSKDARSYRLKVKGRKDIEIALMSASEIARELAAGSIDLGVTGEDLGARIHRRLGSQMAIAARLGFGRADVVVAVPDHWHDVETMADLDDVAAAFPPPARPAPAHRHQILADDARLFLPATRHSGLPDCRKPRRNRRRACGGAGRPDRGYHLDRIDAGGQQSENPGDGVILNSQACLVQSASCRETRRRSVACSLLTDFA